MRPVLERAASLYAGRPEAAQIDQLIDRLDEPMRVAIAGRVKAGKSTLLNALVGEELAATDAGECTRVVTWYREGVTYRVTLDPRHGESVPARFHRNGGALEIDLDERDPADLRRIVVEWPAAVLGEITLIDTPGLGSISEETSMRSVEFLTPQNGHGAEVDAVIYLLRHVHRSDVHFLESFQDESSQTTPINAIGVLSRADEVAAGRLDSMEAAAQVAARWRTNPRLRRLVQTVIPVAGLLAQAGASLREAESQALRRIAGLGASERQSLLLTVDRFVADRPLVDVTSLEREHLLERLGLVGVRLAASHIWHRPDTTADELASHLVSASGIGSLRSALLGQFAARADVLKAHTAITTLTALATTAPIDGIEELHADLERIAASTHEFAELRLLNSLRMGQVDLGQADTDDAERLLGATGGTAHQRLGLDAKAELEEVVNRVGSELRRWQRLVDHPLTPTANADATRVLIRTCEGIIAALTTPEG